MSDREHKVIIGSHARDMYEDEVAAFNRGHKRKAAYKAIDSERDYQDTVWCIETPSSVDPSKPNPLTVGEFLLLIEDIAAQARRVWYTDKKPNEATLEFMRKIGGVAVNCMEQHGAPEREVS